MAAYYNEIEPFAVEWLRNLIRAGHIADGVVDDRSITDVRPEDLEGFAQCHFFAGIGVWSYALRNVGWPDHRPVWTGSCPCQPFSNAGRRKGTEDERHLWPVWFKLIRERRPSIILGEQVASKDALDWFDHVSADLEGTGYAVGAADMCAAGVGAPQIRQRLWFVAQGLADADDGRQPARREAAEAVGQGHSTNAAGRNDRPGPVNGFWRDADWLYCRDGKWRPVEPGLEPLVDGASARVGLLRAYGNAIVAPVAQAFIEAVIDVLE